MHIKQHLPQAKAVLRDPEKSTLLFSFLVSLMNIGVAVVKLVMSLLWHSMWYVTVACYYMVLALARLMILHQYRKTARALRGEQRLRHEWMIYRNGGIVLLFMACLLQVTVLFITRGEGGYVYPGYFIYVMSAFTLYKVIVASIHRRRAWQINSPALNAIRQIGFVDALMSILALQTALFAAFGAPGKGEFEFRMNLLTGAIVCLIAAGIGACMIERWYRSAKNHKVFTNEKSMSK